MEGLGMMPFNEGRLIVARETLKAHANRELDLFQLYVMDRCP